MRFSDRTTVRLLVALLAPCGLLCAGSGTAHAAERLTPLLLAVHEAPIPFQGSDGRMHLVYELWVTNFSSAEATVARVVVRGDGAAVATLDAATVASRLQPAGRRDATATLESGGVSLLFLNLTLPTAVAPARLSHEVTAHLEAAPPGRRDMTFSGGAVAVDRRPVAVIGPPLRGERYIAADSCCDSTRHTRAALPVDGRVRLAQRFAVDWEQMDDDNRIYAGPREDPTSYRIFGREALAVAEARVVSVVDGLPEQTPGRFPEAITLAQADGNSVVLDLGGGRYALYAHLQPGSLRVRPGDRVRRGQVLGLVGNTGNSVAPHLHFHVMDGPSPLDSNGLPYAIDAFEVTGHTPGTAAFDTAEEKGTALTITPETPPRRVSNALPLDQSIVRFGP